MLGLFVCVQGLEYIPQLQAGDTILNARLVSGAERLVMPETKSSE